MAKSKPNTTNKSRTRASTSERKDAVLLALEESRGIVAPACRKAGIGRTQFYKWLKEDKAFADAVADIEEVQLDYVEEKLLQNVEKNDTQSILFYLKTKGKRRGYTERTEVKVELPTLNDNRTEEEVSEIFKARMRLNGEK